MRNFVNDLTEITKAAQEKLLQEIYTTFRYLDSLKPLITEKLKAELLTRANTAQTDLTLDILGFRRLVPELELIPDLPVYNKAIIKIATYVLQDLNLIVFSTKTSIHVTWL